MRLLADDQLTLEGARAILGRLPQLKILPDDPRLDAQVLLVFAKEASRLFLSGLEEHRASDGKLVLVVDTISEAQGAGLLSLKPDSVLLRGQSSFGRITEEVLAVQARRAGSPPFQTDPLLRRVRTVQDQEVSRVTRALSLRDLAVLGFLAAGMNTEQIARELKYSDRTIKAIIHEIVKVFGANNRVHAVALAIRMDLV
ncbi:response regulator transcription factor [Streptomyces sp. NPDC059629]|uniref:helix-turn-helix transcriptional regulator n=1 Tax=Streptomyces sp. NPDC059629 TaxID=3346889 RepID=UPI00368252BE